eukprot:257938_1
MSESIRTREEELLAIRPYITRPLEENDVWCVISGKWWRSWTRYTNFTLKDDIEPSEEPQSLKKSPKPGPIENSDIEGDNSEELRLNLGPNESEFIHSDGYNLLKTWYGSNGSEFPRRVITVGGLHRRTRIDMYPTFVSFCYTDDLGAPDHSTASKFPLSGQHTLAYMLSEMRVCEVVDSSDDEGIEAPEMRLWIKKSEDSEVEQKVDNILGEVESESAPLRRISPRAPADLESEKEEKEEKEDKEEEEEECDGWVHVEAPNLKIPFAQLSERYREFLIERQVGGQWARKLRTRAWDDFRVGDVIDGLDTQRTWYESTIRDVKPGKVLVHYINWPSKWDEWIELPSERLAPRGTHTNGPYKAHQRRTFSHNNWRQNEEGQPKERGVVGLRNVGNTCFMNSTLQCLSNTPMLSDFFLSGRYLADLNVDNPLGWHGKIAEEYGSLMKQLWGDKFRVVAPSSFKQTVAEFAPQFSGYQQHDSSELLSFVLDGLHEDLNRIKQKPFTEPVESDGHDDSMIAKLSWDIHLKRNLSVIVDIMQGQLKSTVICPECKRVSVTFDPFLMLNVPLPVEKDKILKLILVPASLSEPIMLMGPKVPKLGTVVDLTTKLQELTGISAEKLVVCDVWKNKFFKIFKPNEPLAELQENDAIFVYELPKFDAIEVKSHEEDERFQDDTDGRKTDTKSTHSGSQSPSSKKSPVTMVLIDSEHESGQFGQTADHVASLSQSDRDSDHDSDSHSDTHSDKSQTSADGSPRSHDLHPSPSMGQIHQPLPDTGEVDTHVESEPILRRRSTNSSAMYASNWFDSPRDIPEPEAEDHSEVVIGIFHQIVSPSNQYSNYYGSQYNFPNTREFGLPQVITLPKNTPVSADDLRKRVRKVLAPFVPDNINGKEDPYTIRFKDARTGRCAACNSVQRCNGCEVTGQVDVEDGDVVFGLVWEKEFVDLYMHAYKHPIRHSTAASIRNLGTAMSEIRPVSRAPSEHNLVEGELPSSSHEQEHLFAPVAHASPSAALEHGAVSSDFDDLYASVDSSPPPEGSPEGSSGEGGGPGGEGSAGGSEGDEICGDAAPILPEAGHCANWEPGVGCQCCNEPGGEQAGGEGDGGEGEAGEAGEVEELFDEKPVELSECLDAYCIKETLSDADAWYCSKCKKHQKATKKLDLWKVPDICIIHLKRFQQVGEFREKIESQVNFPLSGLDLSQWITDPQSDGAVYDLYAVSNHSGGLGGGHYTAYALNPVSQKWYMYDDSSTYPVGDDKLDDIVSSSAYVLFYIKRGVVERYHNSHSQL